MSTTTLVRLTILLFIILLGICVYMFRSSIFPQNLAILKDTPKIINEEKKTTEEKPEEKNEMSVDRITEIEEALEKLEEENEDQDDSVKALTEKISKTTSPSSSQKGVLATAFTQGSSFSTTSTSYASMSLYVNVACPKKCILWINFYTSSRNVTTPDAMNTYGLFVNNQDMGIYNQATIPVINNAIPVSLNAALPMDTGTHTIEIKAKTSGGKLQSDISYLQVMALEQ